MGLADSLKYSIGGSQGSTNMTNIPVEYAKTISFNKAFRALLSQDKFIARSDYKELVDSYGDVSQVYKTLAEAGMLDDYVAKYALDGSEIVYFRTMFNEIKDLSKSRRPSGSITQLMWNAISNRNNSVWMTFSKRATRPYRLIGNNEKSYSRKRIIR